jgi:DivIVA domain-containing protein
MDLSPVQVSSASFRTVRKGYDPDEVDAFLQRTSKALEEAQQQATAMEARARAAVARLQEMSAAAEQAPAPAPVPDSEAERADVVRVSANEAETISRTLVLAQRTADATVADAEAEAGRIRAEARAESDATLDSTREMSAKLLDDARAEARRLSESERAAAENEVQSLVARREFLVGDVDQLDQFLIDQRERLRTAARQIEAMCDRVPAGLGHVRPPLLSASDDPPGDDTSEQFRPAEAVTLDFDEPDQESEAWGADATPVESADRDDTADRGDVDTVLLEATSRSDVRSAES